jgi:hypothetical protein
VLECDQVITSDKGSRGKKCDTELKKGQVKKYKYCLIDYMVVQIWKKDKLAFDGW